ncbi:MAG: hypothetical protein CMJ49_13205 [Planctomycetaceae bacterium]|nr:hypothetical protein [Planctomycetaceae bacterium]
MSSLNGNDLFGSGPHTIEVGGRSLRHASHQQPGADGQRVTALGRTPREIEQSGTLLADGPDGLTAQLDAIEEALGDPPAALIDQHGRQWDHVIMMRFSPKHVRRIGLRLGVDYRVTYEQVNA